MPTNMQPHMTEQEQNNSPNQLPGKRTGRKEVPEESCTGEEHGFFGGGDKLSYEAHRVSNNSDLFYTVDDIFTG